MRSLGRCVDMRITLILCLKEMEYGLDCEHGDYSAGFIEGKEYRDYLASQKKNCAS
jgi:hypothetical protein